MKPETVERVVRIWSRGDSMSDDELSIAIEAFETTIATLQACDGPGILTVGLRTTLHSMESAQYERERKKRRRSVTSEESK
jgi:hypothetical protein